MFFSINKIICPKHEYNKRITNIFFMENINIKKTGKGRLNLFHSVVIMELCLASSAIDVLVQVSATITYTPEVI